MKKVLMPSMVLLFAFLLVAGLCAQVGQRSHEIVTPMGTETVTEKADLPLNGHLLTSTANTLPGLIWTHPDGGYKWIPSDVAVGNRGTQIIAAHDLNNERAQLLSVFDSNPPTPVWEDLNWDNPDWTLDADSAHTGDYHLVAYSSKGNYTHLVHMYNADSSTPDWTWYAPSPNVKTVKIAIDREPTVVAIGTYEDDGITKDIHLYFLDPDTGAQLSTYSQTTDYGLRGWDLSADGKTLYFHDGGYGINIFDIASLTVIHTANSGGSFDGHCISGDGTKFAFGKFYYVEIHEYLGGSWVSYSYSLGSGRYGDEMDFSDDGSTLGFGVSQFSPDYGKTEAYMMDIATKTVTAHVVNDSNGVYQDVCSGASISHDGRYFALSRWGDQMNANPEVQILENGVGLAGSIDTQGSAWDVDVSWDGQVVVSGCKSVHANVSGNGGDVDYYDMGDEDMDLLGVPKIGATVTINVYTDPSNFFALVLGTKDDPEGYMQYPNGTLYLDVSPPNFYFIFPVMQADPSGLGSMTAIIPNDPLLVGTTVFLQTLFAATGGSFTYSKDYLTLQFLP